MDTKTSYLEAVLDATKRARKSINETMEKLPEVQASFNKIKEAYKRLIKIAEDARV